MYRTLAIICLLTHLVASYKIKPISFDMWNHTYSPHWDEKTQSLYFVDFLSPTRVLNRYDMRENRIYSATIEGNQVPAFFIPLKKRANQFAGGIERTVKIINWNGIDPIGTTSQHLFTVEKSSKYDGNYWDIAKASPSHKFYGGTYRIEICSFTSAANASLYGYSKEAGVIRLLRNEKVAAGIDWNEKEKKFYHIDSCNGIIREFDYDPKTFELCNERIAFKFHDVHGDEVPSYIPLGMTIDDEGFLWVATYYGGTVLKIDPRKSKIIKKIKMPAEIITSVAFGGPKLDILFVMTGSKAFKLSSGEVLSSFSSGSGLVYMIKGLGATGFAGRKLLI